MSDFNIKSFFKNRFNGNNSEINNVKTGNPWTPWTNQKPVKTEEKDEAVELEDDALKFIDLFNGNSFFDAQIPEKDLKPVPNEENNDTAKSDNGQKDTPDRSEELLKGPKISDTIDTIGNWRDWIKPALPADHVAWGNGQKDEINGDLRDEIPEKGLKPLPAEENNDTAKSDNKQKVTPGWLEKLLNGPKVSDRNLNNDIQLR